MTKTKLKTQPHVLGEAAQAADDVLRRLAELHTIVKSSHDNDTEAEEYIYEEYRALQEPMAKLFLPLVNTLVRAGLITMQFRDDLKDKELYLRDWKSIGVDPDVTYLNGNIFIEGHYVSTACPRLNSDGTPNVGKSES